MNSTTSNPAAAGDLRRAVIYLRVSSRGQLTGHSEDGYSIEAQREACTRYAASLSASVVREYVEPGRTATNARREALQQLLADLPDLRPDFVIFYDLSRLAREEADAFYLLAQIRQNGSRLMSTREPVDDSPQGLLLFAVMAGVNAFRSRDDAVKVKAGLERKHQDGGSIGPARIGYLNTRETVNGREVASIEVDTERVALVRQAFDLFATGDYTLTTLTDYLDDAGLRTRPTRTRPSHPLQRSSIYRMLTNDYYVGIVTRGGVKVQGRHEAIIDVATFERVQQVLAAHKASGDRSSKHHHYLGGSIFCGRCGQRFGFGRHRSKDGSHYEYFSCNSRVHPRGACGARYFRVHLTEAAIERFYATVTLSKPEQDALRVAMKAYVEARSKIGRREIERQTRRLRELQAQQQKLVQLYYRDAVSEDVLRAEQQRIKTETASAEQRKATADFEAQDTMRALDEALSLVDQASLPYLMASPTQRRLLNQALYEQLLIEDNSGTEGVDAKQHPLYELLAPVARDLADSRPKPQSGRIQANRARNHPRKEHDPTLAGSCSHFEQMAERAGFEPAMELTPILA